MGDDSEEAIIRKAKARENKRKKRMKVSGRKVFELQKIINKKEK